MASNRPQIGVMFRREQDPATLADEARRAEALGFDQMWIVEDCFYMGGISQAAIALTATTSITVGIGINPGVAHNPAILAMEYATLARAFPGRLIGGIGHGVAEWMEQIGVKPKSPLKSIEEITTAVMQLLRGETVTVDGEYVKLTDVVLDPPPAVVPPVLLGVRAQKSVALAGRIADGVLLAEGSAPGYVTWARDLMNGQRSTPAYVGVYTNCLVDDDDPAAAFDTMRRFVAGQVGNELSPATAVLDYANELQTLIDRGGPDALYADMPEAWVRDLAVTGSSDEGRATIDRLGESGADSVILVPIDEGRDWANWITTAAGVLNR